MDHFPEELQKILESERTLKVGINIRNDGRKLWKDWGIASASLVELGALCIQVMGDLENRRKVRSMTTLAEELLGHAVAKDSFVRKGDWEWKNLSARQLSYAANDAFVTFEVAQRIKDLQQRPQPPGELEYTVPLQTITKSGGGKLTTVRGTLDRIEMEGFTDEDIVVQPPPSSSKVAGDKKESADVKEKERRQTTKTTIVVEGRKASKAALSTTVKGRKDEDITKAKSGMLPIAQPLLPPSHTFKPPLLPEPIVLKYAGGQWTRKVIPASDFAQNSTMQANNTPTNTPSLHIPGGHSGLHKDSEPGVTSAKIVKSYQKTVVIIPRAALMQKASNMASSSTMARINGRHAPAGSNTAIPYNTDRSGTQRESDEEEEEDTIGSVPRLPQHLLPTSMEHLDVLQRNQKVWRETAGKDIAEDLDEAFLPDDDWHLRQNEAGVVVEDQPKVVKFLNVPYATVPERWRPSVRAQPWQGVRDCTQQGPMCHQPTSGNPLVSLAAGDDDEEGEGHIKNNKPPMFDEENCLNLNIFVPKDHLEHAQSLLPVMVWIHGGGFKDGGNGMSLYDASNFVARSIEMGRPVIVVTINYRLNFFGFLSCKELVEDMQQDPRFKDATMYDKCVGNWGLKDQRLALEWVRDHIEVFGGHPTKVTAFGESAGAVSIAYHMVIPRHHGLFQRAIMQSGAATTMSAGRAAVEGQRFFDFVCRKFKLTDLSGKEKLEALRKMPAAQLASVGDNGTIGMFSPTIDPSELCSSSSASQADASSFLPVDIRQTIHDTNAYDPNIEAVMLGDCRDEGIMFVKELGAASMKRWPKFVSRYCPPGHEQEFARLYGTPTTNAEAIQISAQALSDSIFLYPIHATSRALLRKNTGPAAQRHKPVEIQRFHFDRPLQIVEDMGMGMGAHHAVELPFVFGSAQFAQLMTGEERELSRRVQQIWILFAWNETQIPFLRSVTNLLPSDIGVATKEAIVFTEQCNVVQGQVERLSEAKLKFWEAHERWVFEKRQQPIRPKL
ncbi:hypothetical protein BGZ73_005939 [Actinomortierella ambigua]|nr:hypothetical protein BGZ73_005939 [Actinomortierella ambigua]